MYKRRINKTSAILQRLLYERKERVRKSIFLDETFTQYESNVHILKVVR